LVKKRPDSESAQTPAEFVAKVREGDQKANDIVLGRIDKILAHRGYGIPAQEHQDLRQKVIVELWQAVDRPDFEPERFWGLVKVVTSRRCIDWRRSQKNEVAFDAESELWDTSTGPLANLLYSEKVQMAQAVLAKMSPSCRELIRLYVDQNMTYQQIAAVLGNSENALRVKLHRCISRARATLENLNGGDGGI
jgi:RNA polymerase sigma factor (sigma-70 family)